MTIKIKRGASLILDCEFLFDGVPEPLTDYTISATLRRGDAIVDTFTVTVTDEALGLYTLSIIDTSAAPIAQCYFDIRYLRGEIVSYTETIPVMIEREFTRPGDGV